MERDRRKQLDMTHIPMGAFMDDLKVPIITGLPTSGSLLELNGIEYTVSHAMELVCFETDCFLFWNVYMRPGRSGAMVTTIVATRKGEGRT